MSLKTPRFRRGALAGLIAVMAIVAVSTSESASAMQTFGFGNITNNTSNTGAGLSVTVFGNGDTGYTSLGNQQVVFLFKVATGTAGVISEIYFQGGALQSLFATNINNVSIDGVNFVADSVNSTNPAQLPGGNSLSPIPFIKTSNFSADVAKNTADGVKAGEATGIKFTLKGTNTYADVVNALLQGASQATVSGHGANTAVDMHGGLRIGVHVREAAPNKSDSFVNTPTEISPGPDLAPEPTSLGMAVTALGMFGLVGLRRLRRRPEVTSAA